SSPGPSILECFIASWFVLDRSRGSFVKLPPFVRETQSHRASSRRRCGLDGRETSSYGAMLASVRVGCHDTREVGNGSQRNRIRRAPRLQGHESSSRNDVSINGHSFAGQG